MIISLINFIDPENGKLNKVTDVAFQEFEQNLEKKYAYIYGNRPDIPPFMITRKPDGNNEHLCSKVFCIKEKFK